MHQYSRNHRDIPVSCLLTRDRQHSTGENLPFFFVVPQLLYTPTTHLSMIIFIFAIDLIYNEPYLHSGFILRMYKIGLFPGNVI